MVKRPAHATPLLLALAVAAAVVAACGSPATTGRTSGDSPVPTRGQAVAPATSVPGAAIPGATPAPRPTPVPTPVPPVVTVTGLVMQIFSTGDFLLNDGHVSYTVAMSLTTKVVNLRRREVPVQFIQVANSVQVTGLLTGSTITAQTVLVPTNKDGP